MKKIRTEIISGDEVVFLGSPENSWNKLSDHGVLEEGEAYIVHFATPSELILVGVPGMHKKSLFQRI